MLDRITVNPDICEGKPTVRNLRITVDFILKLIGDGYTADEIIEKYPELEKEDIYQAASCPASFKPPVAVLRRLLRSR